MMFSSALKEELAGGKIASLPPEKTLADVIVGVAFEQEGHALRHKGAEALTRGALEVDRDGVLGNPLAPYLRVTSLPVMVPTAAMDVLDGDLGDNLFTLLDGRLAGFEQGREVERLVQAVVLLDLAEATDFGSDVGQ